MAKKKLTKEIINQICEKLRQMEGREVDEGATIDLNPSPRSLGPGGTDWEISYKT
jgi:hypothetical protein